jgi:dTDP-4-dehydrorhamnose reductase
MYAAKQDPVKMQAVEDLVFKRICNVSCKRLIHLSTIHVVSYPDEPYSKMKRIQEDRVLKSYPDATILRLGSVIGPELQKNALYDLVHDQPLWVTANSLYTYISTGDVATIIMQLIEQPRKGIFNVAGSSAISVSQMAVMFGKHPTYGTTHHHIPMDTSWLDGFYPVKTSREYVEEFWKGFIHE